MGQFIFFTLFVITLLGGIFAYFAPKQKPLDPVGFVMRRSGFDSMEFLNRKRSQQLSMTTTNGLMKVRKEMDNLAVQQKKFLDTLVDQQQILMNATNRTPDVLQLKALTAQMQDEQRILVAHGQDLITLNDKLARNRQWISDQIDLVNINNETSMHAFQQHYDMLKDQASGFLDKVGQYNQEVRDRMAKFQDQLNDLANHAANDSHAQQQVSKELIERMLDKERADMLKLVDSENRSKILLEDARQNFLDSKQRFKDALQQTQDSIDEERRRIQDQEWINKQRVVDQVQHMRDQEAQERR